MAENVLRLVKPQISKNKYQINPKLQFPINTKVWYFEIGISNLFVIWKFDIWDLQLVFGRNNFGPDLQDIWNEIKS